MAPPELDARFSSCLLKGNECKLLVAEFPGLAVGNVHLSSSPELRERQLADCAKVGALVLKPPCRAPMSLNRIRA